MAAKNGYMDSRKTGQSNFGGGKKSVGQQVKSGREGNAYGGATGVTPSGKPKSEPTRGNAKP